MRYLLITYDESLNPSPDYDLFSQVGRFCEGEGLTCGLADLHAPSAVQEQIQADQMELGNADTWNRLKDYTMLRDMLYATMDEFADIPNADVVKQEVYERYVAVFDNLESMLDLVEERLKVGSGGVLVAVDEASQTIPYLIPPAKEASCEKVSL